MAWGGGCRGEMDGRGHKLVLDPLTGPEEVRIVCEGRGGGAEGRVCVWGGETGCPTH
jgi:hypothetical protein